LGYKKKDSVAIMLTCINLEQKEVVFCHNFSLLSQTFSFFLAQKVMLKLTEKVLKLKNCKKLSFGFGRYVKDILAKQKQRFTCKVE
jgi:hypothetical protein